MERRKSQVEAGRVPRDHGNLGPVARNLDTGHSSLQQVSPQAEIFQQETEWAELDICLSQLY